MSHLKTAVVLSLLFSISYFLSTYLLAEVSSILWMVSWYTNTDFSSFEYLLLGVYPVVLCLTAFWGIRCHNARPNASPCAVLLALPIFYGVYGLGNAVVQNMGFLPHLSHRGMCGPCQQAISKLTGQWARAILFTSTEGLAAASLLAAGVQRHCPSGILAGKGISIGVQTVKRHIMDKTGTESAPVL